MTLADDRAVSDLVGYVLTVSIILLGVGIVATAGVDQIERAQEAQNARSGEWAMQLLGANLDGIQESRAAVRTTTLSLSSGRLAVLPGDGPSAVTVAVSGTGDPPTTYDMGTIAYRLEDATLAYEGGAVFRNDTQGSAVLLAAPTFRCSGDRAVVSVVTLQGPAAGRSVGGGTAGVVARENDSAVRFPVNRTGPDSVGASTGVTVTIDSAYEAGWDDHFLDPAQEWTPTATPSQYRCEPSTGTTMPVYVRQTVLNVSVR